MQSFGEVGELLRATISLEQLPHGSFIDGGGSFGKVHENHLKCHVLLNALLLLPFRNEDHYYLLYPYQLETRIEPLGETDHFEMRVCSVELMQTLSLVRKEASCLGSWRNTSIAFVEYGNLPGVFYHVESVLAGLCHLLSL